jgi:hypothetical protein
MTHLAEGLCFNALLTLKVENSLNNNNNSINLLMFDNSHKGQKRIFAEIETRSPVPQVSALPTELPWMMMIIISLF